MDFQEEKKKKSFKLSRIIPDENTNVMDLMENKQAVLFSNYTMEKTATNEEETKKEKKEIISLPSI